MNEIDRREEWMGLGIILTELRMRVWLENRGDTELGMRLQRRIGWRTLFSTGTNMQRHCVSVFLNQFDIELKEHYYNKDNLMKWLFLLDKLESLYNVRSGLTDQGGRHMLQWVMDNTVPKKWNEFLVWVESYDNECEIVNGLYK
jgi:hypothetical protein